MSWRAGRRHRRDRLTSRIRQSAKIWSPVARSRASARRELPTSPSPGPALHRRPGSAYLPIGTSTHCAGFGQSVRVADGRAGELNIARLEPIAASDDLTVETVTRIINDAYGIA